LRRNWIKIYPEGFLRRTLFKELLPIERWVWIGFLCLAGDNAVDGKICVAEDMGYTDEQLAKLLDTGIDILKVSKKKMIKFEKISVDKNNVIQILSWDIYQSEYQRQRDYREEYKKKLQREVTTQSNDAELHIDRDRDKDREEDIDKKKNNILIGEIISYLNLKAKKNFRPTSAIAIKNITARLNEKYILEQFKKVIDIKCSHWLELKDGELVGVIVTDEKGREQDMSIYLSPDTLFGNKFEKYLNQNANKEAIRKAVKHEKDWQKIKEVRPEETYKYKPIPEEANKIIIKAIPTYRDKKGKE